MIVDAPLTRVLTDLRGLEVHVLSEEYITLALAALFYHLQPSFIFRLDGTQFSCHDGYCVDGLSPRALRGVLVQPLEMASRLRGLVSYCEAPPVSAVEGAIQESIKRRVVRPFWTRIELLPKDHLLGFVASLRRLARLLAVDAIRNVEPADAPRFILDLASGFGSPYVQLGVDLIAFVAKEVREALAGRVRDPVIPFHRAIPEQFRQTVETVVDSIWRTEDDGVADLFFEELADPDPFDLAPAAGSTAWRVRSAPGAAEYHPPECSSVRDAVDLFLMQGLLATAREREVALVTRVLEPLRQVIPALVDSMLLRRADLDLDGLAHHVRGAVDLELCGDVVTARVPRRVAQVVTPLQLQEYSRAHGLLQRLAALRRLLLVANVTKTLWPVRARLTHLVVSIQNAVVVEIQIGLAALNATLRAASSLEELVRAHREFVVVISRIGALPTLTNRLLKFAEGVATGPPSHGLAAQLESILLLLAAQFRRVGAAPSLVWVTEAMAAAPT